MSLSVPPETTEKLWLLDVFGEYRKRPVARNALRIPQILCCLLSPKAATIFVLILSNLMLNCHKIPLPVKSMFKNFVYIWMSTFILCSQTFFPDLRLRYCLKNALYVYWIWSTSSIVCPFNYYSHETSAYELTYLWEGNFWRLVW